MANKTAKQSATEKQSSNQMKKSKIKIQTYQGEDTGGDTREHCDETDRGRTHT